MLAAGVAARGGVLGARGRRHACGRCGAGGAHARAARGAPHGQVARPGTQDRRLASGHGAGGGHAAGHEHSGCHAVRAGHRVPVLPERGRCGRRLVGQEREQVLLEVQPDVCTCDDCEQVHTADCAGGQQDAPAGHWLPQQELCVRVSAAVPALPADSPQLRRIPGDREWTASASPSKAWELIIQRPIQFGVHPIRRVGVGARRRRGGA